MDVVKFLLSNMDTIKGIAELGIFLVLMLSSSARGAIAAVNDILSSGVSMTDEAALQKASDLMGKKLPYIPEGLRKMIIQFLFDNMKNALKKNEVAKQA